MVVLVVDDEELVLGVVASILKRHGHQVLVARSVNEARRIWWRETLHLDLVITDIQLHGASGFALADELKLSWPDVPVLFMSGDYRECDEDLLRRLGSGRAFLEKPFSERGLMGKLAGFLGVAPVRGCERLACAAAN